MPPPRIVEALDEFEDGDARLGLRLECAPIEQLTFERGDARVRRAEVLAALRDYCAGEGAAQPLWTPAGYVCLRVRSGVFLFFDQWAAFLLLCCAPLIAWRSYRLAQAGAARGTPWLWRDATGFYLGLLPWGAAFGLLWARVTWPLLLLPAGVGGSWWLTGYLARQRGRRPVAVSATAATAVPAAIPRCAIVPQRPSDCRAVVPVPFTPVLRTIPIPPGPLADQRRRRSPTAFVAAALGG